MICVFKLQSQMLHALSRSTRLLVLALAGCGLSGLASTNAPSTLEATTQHFFGTPAYAQTPEQVVQYARTAYEIEQIRRRNYAKAKRLLGGNVPEDVCSQRTIPSAVKGICEDFSRQAAEVTKRSGLTSTQFNDITRRKDRDPELRQKIRQELLRLQKAN